MECGADGQENAEGAEGDAAREDGGWTVDEAVSLISLC